MLKRLLGGLFIAAGVGAMTAGAMSGGAAAQEVTLKLHQFLPLRATIPAKFIDPWIEKVESESGGRIKIDHFPSMQLGGKPPELIQQATDGAVDIIWTVLGYTPGRFPRAEAFELPFMMTNAEQTSMAFQEYADKHMQNDFPGLKVIAVHTHGPGILHTKSPVTQLGDLKGMKLRGPTRVITGMLDTLGATAIGMPVPAVPEAISKGVIDGTVIPWEVTLPLKMSELVDNHTGFSGDRGFYTATFGFVMNGASYDRLPDDLKKVIDDHSLGNIAATYGQVWDDIEEYGKKLRRETGELIELSEDEMKAFDDRAKTVVDKWIAEATGNGMDGSGMVEKARAAVAKQAGQ